MPKIPQGNKKNEGSKLSPFALHVKNYSKGCGSDQCEGAKVCIGKGKIPANMVLIGEAPGESEALFGIPFVGPAGHLLDEIIQRAFESLPDSKKPRICITNLVGCIPRNEEEDNKKASEPSMEQIKSCTPRLQEFVLVADGKDPRMAHGEHGDQYLMEEGTIKCIVCVGRLAEDETDTKLQRAIKFHRSIKMYAIKHPSAILRNNIAQRGHDVQRAVVTLYNAWADTSGLKL